MVCRDIEKNDIAIQYLSGELDSKLQDDFEGHLLECQRCQSILETLLHVRDDLQLRAHEIRSPSRIFQGYLRWAWGIAVGLFALAIGLGGTLYVMHRRSTLIEAKKHVLTQSSGPANLANTSSSVQHESGEHGSNKAPDLSAQVTLPEVPPNRSISNSSTSKLNLPINERNNINFKLKNSQVLAGNAPRVGAAPTSGVNLGSRQPSANSIAADGSDAPDNSVAAVPSPQASQSEGSKTEGHNPPSQRATSSQVNDVQIAKELFRLGLVQPPPYTFAGLAASTPSKRNTGPARLSVEPASGVAHPNAGRTNFQTGMDAYVEKRYRDAVELLEDALRDEPAAADVNLYLGISLLMVGKPEDSMAPLQAAGTNEKSSYAQSAHFFLAKAYIQTADLAKAEAELQKAASLPGRLNNQAHSLLAQVQALRNSTYSIESGKPH